jgi:hypothetical protein
MDAAARNGQLEVVTWLYQTYPSVGCSKVTLEATASKGFLDVTRFLRVKLNQPVTAAAIAAAAGNGHLHVVKYLHKHFRGNGLQAPSQFSELVKGVTPTSSRFC